MGFPSRMALVKRKRAISGLPQGPYTVKNLKNVWEFKFNLKIIQGGLPAKARNNGAQLVETPYVLFMDSDMFLLDSNLLTDSIKEMRLHKFDLLTTKVRTTSGKYNYVFRTFDMIQKISKRISPFCLGGFMLFRTDTFNELGGFDEQAQVSEDYLLSKQVEPKKFKILNIKS